MKLSRLFTPFISFLLLGFGSYQNIFCVTSSKKELDTNIIVALKNSESYSKKEIQNIFFNELRNEVNYSYRKLDTIDAINNYLYLKINKEDLSKINSFHSVNYAYEEIDYELEIEDFDPLDPTYIYEGDNEILSTNYSKIDMNIDSSLGEGENTIVAILDSALNYDHEAFSSISSSSLRYNKTDIDTLVNQDGFNGKEYRYINNKVVFSYDYPGNDDDVKSKNTHGSHVASLSLGNGRYKGIAPSSQLAFMKVFNDRASGCTSSIYLKALEDAYLLDVDAINMSFGTSLNYTTSSSDLAVDEVLKTLKETGINVYIAAANDGRDVYTGSDYEYTTLDSVETGVMGYLAMNEDSITVANSSLKEDMYNVYALIDNKRSVRIYDRIVNHLVKNSSTNKYEKTIFPKEYRFFDFIKDKSSFTYVYVPSLGNDSDYNDINVNNKIAIVDRGEIPFIVKIYNAIKHGASGLIIVNTKNEDILQFSYVVDDTTYATYPYLPVVYDSEGNRTFDLSYINIPVALVGYEAKALFNNASENKISFYNDSMSPSSSMGATASLSLKPDLTAPGTNIYAAYSYDSSSSTYLNSAYTYMSGTSMASPNLMGAYSALLSSFDLTNNRREIAKTLRNKMASSTTILKDEYDVDVSPRREGNGLVNIKNAFNSTSYLLYNDENNVELYNDDDISVGHIKFDLSLIEESEGKDYEISLNVMAPKIIEETIDGKTVELFNSNDELLENISLGKITSKNGENIVSIDYNINSSTKDYLSHFSNGTYLEGYVTLKSENEELHIPYLGFYGDYETNNKPYEDFSFEKEENKIYESDLMDRYIEYTYKKSKVETGSYMMLGGDEAYYKRNILTSDFSFKTLYNEMEYVYDYDDDLYHIYTGDYTALKARGIIIQLFMKRSVLKNKVELKDSEGNILTPSDQYFNYSFKDNTSVSSLTGDGTELFRNYVLAQSTSLVGREYYTHRSFYYLPLVTDGKLDTHLFENGVYSLNFEFTLVNGSVYKSKYVLHIGENYEPIPQIYDVTLLNNILRIYVKEENIDKILINNNEYSATLNKINGNSSYFEIDLTSLNEDLFIEIKNTHLNSTYLKYFKDQKAFISSTFINENYDLTIVERENSGYLLTIYKDKEHSEIYNDNNNLFIGASFDFNVASISTNINDNQINIEYKTSQNNELITFTYSLGEYVVQGVFNDDDVEKISSLLKPLLYTLGGLIIIGSISFSVVIIIKKVNKRKD